MSTEVVRHTLSTELTDNFPAAQPTCGLYFENHPFQPPSNAPWAMVSVIPNMSRAAQLGGGRYMTTGVIQVDIHVPEDTGTKTMLEIGDSVALILQDRNIPNVGVTGSVTVFGRTSHDPKPRVGWYTRCLLFQYRAWTTTP